MATPQLSPGVLTREVDLTVGRYFKEGSTFSAYEIDTTTKSSSSLLTSIKLEDGNVQYIYMNDFKCIPRQLNEHVLDFLDKTIYSNKQGYNFVGVDAAGPHLGERVSMKTKLDNESFSTEQTNTHPYRTYHTNKQTHVYSPYKNSYHNQLKVLFSYSGSWYKSGEITTDCSTSDASFCVLAPNNDIMYAESVQSVLKSKPIEKLIDKVCRWSGYYSYAIISNIPALPTNKIYTDDDVLDAYGITDLESRKFWLS